MMRFVKRLEQQTLFLATLAVFGIVSAPFAPPLALADGNIPSSVQVSQFLNTGCGGAKQLADVTPETPAGDQPEMPNQTPEPQGTSSPSALPSATQIPLYAPASGPGQFVPSAATPIPTASIPPVPTPTPTIAAAAKPIVITRATPAASSALEATPTGSPAPMPTLGPNQIAILADEVSGSTKLGIPADASGDVNVFYSEGVLVGDKAHYDGNRYITVTGHTHLINNVKDTRLDADTIIFDVRENRAVLTNGRGATSRGVETGKIYYTADHLRANSNGVIHGTAATFTTCENPRGGYHMYAHTMDVTPGQKLVARHVLVFLGGFAILYLPLLVIPLNHSDGERHPVVFAPEVGYNQSQGYYVRARLGFGTQNTYYGYYRVEEYSKAGLGLGYVAYIARRDGRRQTNVNVYTLQGQNGTGREDNVSIQDTENFSQRFTRPIRLDVYRRLRPLRRFAGQLQLIGHSYPCKPTQFRELYVFKLQPWFPRKHAERRVPDYASTQQQRYPGLTAELYR